MFTWMPIHEETAQRLLEFRERQPELLGLLREMQQAGLMTIKLTDKASDGTEIPLAEIDPFTFLANFNRGLRRENRIALWRFLRDRWKLTSALPEDFEGVPVADLRKAWFMPWAAERKPEHVSMLWDLFAQAMEGGRAGIRRETFDGCLKLRGLGIAYLSFGLFWARPSEFLGTDYKALDLAKARGVTVTPKDFASYSAWLDAVRSHAPEGFPAFSREADVEASRFRFTISDAAFARLLDRFHQRMPGFRTFAEPGKLETQELDYKRKALSAFATRPGIAGARAMVEAGEGQRLLAEFNKRAGNLANYRSWTVTFGDDDAVAARLLGVLLDVAAQPWTGVETVAPLFAAIDEAGLKPSWDALSAALWLLRPEDYFPVKIDEYRKLAQELEQSLPAGRPTPAAFAAVRAFGEAFREQLASLEPRDWTDVQSFIFVVCPKKETAPPMAPTLAAPFGELFTSAEEAETAFSWFRRAMERLGLNEASGDDGRIALTLPVQQPPMMRFNFGNFVMCSFVGPTAREGRFEFACLAERKPDDAVQVGAFSQFGRKAGEPECVLVRIPVASLERSDVAESFDLSMDALRERFADWQKSPYRNSHRPELFQMIFDEAYRREMLAKGLPTVQPEPSKAEPIEPERAYIIAEALDDLFIGEPQLRTILAALRNKRNLILQGAPGVGKSFIAERIAFALLGCADRSRVKTIQFHQSYGYEDFIQGWRPNEQGGFKLRNGHFYEFCHRAQDDPDRDYVLIIDEINRGNLSRIFGELMVLLEPDKRGSGFAMPLTYSPDDTFYVPERLHIIGLMNTADRSLAMVDYALRRRFAFITIEPGFASANFERALYGRGASTELVNRIRTRIDEVNRMIADDAANLGRGYLIGHSFFVPRTQIEDGDAWYRAIIEWEILPLLHEYWVDDPARLERVRSLLLD